MQRLVLSRLHLKFLTGTWARMTRSFGNLRESRVRHKLLSLTKFLIMSMNKYVSIKWESYLVVAGACLHSSHTCRLAEYPKSRPAARSHWCCRCRPSAGEDVLPSAPSRWRYTPRWSSVGRTSPLSYPL